MVQSSQGFPHINLTLTHKEQAKSLGGGGSKETQTEINKNNRQGHGSKIKNIVSSVVDDWRTFKEEQEQEEQENKQSTLADAITLILEIDTVTFDLDDLRTSEIEIISELEDGYIIGASTDTNLTELQKKIDKFLNEQKGGNVIAKILNIIDRNQRHKFILSPPLLQQWEQIKDDNFYVIEVGISCLGTKTKLPEHPDKKNYKNPENYTKAINKWIDQRNSIYTEWKDLVLQRQEYLLNFISKHKYYGKILSLFVEDASQFSKVRDSFSCLIQISGLGLKDLVLNFPYVFEVIETISEIENEYIIGTSANINLTELQKKVEFFLKNQNSGGIVVNIFDLLDDKQRPEFILSPKLLQTWDQIKDDQVYIVKVGISCLGTKSKLREYPKPQSYKNIGNYVIAINKWIEYRDLSYEEWDDLAYERQEHLSKFIANPKYHGELLSGFIHDIPQSDRIPDSFSCLMQISGLGLKDLVFNFPYVFEVTEQGDIYESDLPEHEISEYENISFILESPDKNAPKVCIIDSGIQEEHPLLKNAIDSGNSISLIPSEINLTADMVSNGGHGTRVAGAVIYPRTIPQKGIYKPIFWLQNARILDKNCRLLDKLYPPELLERIVEYYYSQTATRIFNHSLASDAPCRTRYMSAWAYTIDQLSYEKDILFIVAAGNIPLDSYRTSPRLSVKHHLLARREYPDYLTENSCRIANPSQSFQALTVGSINSNSFRDLSWSSLGEKDEPSAFSCSGLGIWDTIKPEVVEYGGDILKDENQPPNFICNTNTSPELVRSTLSPTPSPLVAADDFGTSFAAPRVTHIAARLAAEFPNEGCLLYRALIVQSARWPDWALAKTNEEKYNVIRQIGYGIPDVERAISNTPNRITLITQGEKFIKAGEVDIYQVQLPDSLRSPGEEFKILLEITLSYKAQPRRTRRNRRKYLSTWLDWECSKQGEDSKHFLGRMLANHKIPEDAEKGDELFTWTLGKEKRYKSIKNVSRSIGTIQKDWAVVKSYNLREAFCIAVVGHEGWKCDSLLAESR
ncbi:S8 family peptidase [Dolichospermum circinale]|uniref:S8 family peptidase n=1 Tax=Dolichospermum circinale TaxID=109265 RepID=UPI00232C2AA8|nr:S8 family peptidase [Dolichospermum circinale]MDB9449326.1 S8 family peptidase [Dolichospermum circinale CS-547]